MSKKIDWSAPLELSDGTPVKLAGTTGANSVPYNPDVVGDYYLVREDGWKFTAAQVGYSGNTFFIARPDGTEWGPGPASPRLTVRNRKDREVAVHSAFSGRWVLPVVAEVDGMVVVRHQFDPEETMAFWKDTGERVGGSKRYRMEVPKPEPVVTYSYSTIRPGRKGDAQYKGVRGGGISYDSLEALERVQIRGSRDDHDVLGVLETTYEDGKPVSSKIVKTY